MFIHQTLNGVNNTGHSINVQSYKDLRHSISSSSTVPTSLSACLGPRVFHEESIYIIIVNRVERMYVHTCREYRYPCIMLSTQFRSVKDLAANPF